MRTSLRMVNTWGFPFPGENPFWRWEATGESEFALTLLPAVPLPSRCDDSTTKWPDRQYILFFRKKYISNVLYRCFEGSHRQVDGGHGT